jgi:hypothetical protein
MAKLPSGLAHLAIVVHLSALFLAVGYPDVRARRRRRRGRFAA